MTSRKNTLIIFARYPRAGEVKTRLGAEIGMEKAAEVYRQLAEGTFAIAGELAGMVRSCLFYEPSASIHEMRKWVGDGLELFPQEGEDLGERMRNVFRKVFDEGANASLIVGTDIPDLDAGLVRKGFEHLEREPVVVGPSVDGGYYLLGMQKGVGDLFSGVRWSSQHVLADTLARVSNLGLSCGLLPELADIDTKEDWERFLLNQRS